MSEFERIVTVTPAFDKGKEYGIGSCRIVFVLKGPKGAVQFMIGTDWFLPHTQIQNREWQYDFDRKFNKINPQGWDVGYHSPVPRYEGQTSMKCDLMPSGHCYYDGSSLRADEWVPQFLAGGTDWLWPALETEYRELFEGAQVAA